MKQFLEAANWALSNSKEITGINVKSMPIDDTTSIALFNASKSLLYSGYVSPHQKYLKGLIVLVRNNIAEKVIAPCLSKFYNYKETEEKNQYKDYLNINHDLYFAKKFDGVNIRPYYNEATKNIEFATRGTLLGCGDLDNGNNQNHGLLARNIAKEKYSILLDKNFVQEYICVFELIHPDTKILTNYGETKDLILLTAFKDNQELSLNEIKEFAQLYNFNYASFWLQEVNYNNFEISIERLLDSWKNTDQEGSVIIFANKHSTMPQYRLKIKNTKYLEILKISQFCTLKNTKEICETNKLYTWEALRNFLYSNYKIEEEIEMGYKLHFEVYNYWKSTVNRLQRQISNQFLDIYNQNPDATQKEFAMKFLESPYKSFYFEMLKFARKQKFDNEDFWNTAPDNLFRIIEDIVPL